jgi:hypothetical protein
MKFIQESIALFCLLSTAPKTVVSFTLSPSRSSSIATSPNSSTSLKVSIGIGPSEEEQSQLLEKSSKEELIEEPNHDLFRDSRLTEFDKKCDEWFGNMLQSDAPSFLGKISEEALRRINTLCPLEREVSLTLHMSVDFITDKHTFFVPISISFFFSYPFSSFSTSLDKI